MRFSPLLALLLAGCVTGGQSAPPPVALHIDVFGSVRAQSVQTLVIVLNSDGTPAERPDHAAFAARAAGAIPDSAAVAILRPGYSDGAGHRSPGERGVDAGDNYTGDRIAAIASAVEALRARYPHARTVLVGESGGAAIAANLAGMRPDLVDGMVLVGCPCTLPEWRQYMEKRTPAEPWERPVASLDPLKTAGGIAPGLRAAIIVGADDAITPVKFSRSYAEALTLRGIATDYRILPGRGHAILQDPEVLAATRRVAQALPRSTP